MATDFNKAKKVEWLNKMRAKKVRENDFRLGKVEKKGGANKKEPCCFRDQRDGRDVRCGTWVERNSDNNCSERGCHHHMCQLHRWYLHGLPIAGNRVCWHCRELSDTESDESLQGARPPRWRTTAIDEAGPRSPDQNKPEKSDSKRRRKIINESLQGARQLVKWNDDDGAYEVEWVTRKEIVVDH